MMMMMIPDSAYHIISYHRLWMAEPSRSWDRRKLKVKIQSVLDDDVQKRFLEKPHFELVAKGVFRLGRCYIFWQGVPGHWASNRESSATYGWSLDWWHQKTIDACRMKWPSARKTVYWHERSSGSLLHAACEDFWAVVIIKSISVFLLYCRYWSFKWWN